MSEMIPLAGKVLVDQAELDRLRAELAELRSYAEARNDRIRQLEEVITSLVGLFDPYGRGRVQEPESECADRIEVAIILRDEDDDESPELCTETAPVQESCTPTESVHKLNTSKPD